VLNGASSGMEAAAAEILKTVQSDGSEIEMDPARPAVSSSVGEPRAAQRPDFRRQLASGTSRNSGWR
jgi:hypothetical protein